MLVLGHMESTISCACVPGACLVWYVQFSFQRHRWFIKWSFSGSSSRYIWAELSKLRLCMFELSKLLSEPNKLCSCSLNWTSCVHALWTEQTVLVLSELNKLCLMREAHNIQQAVEETLICMVMSLFSLIAYYFMSHTYMCKAVSVFVTVIWCMCCFQNTVLTFCWTKISASAMTVI